MAHLCKGEASFVACDGRYQLSVDSSPATSLCLQPRQNSQCLRERKCRDFRSHSVTGRTLHCCFIHVITNVEHIGSDVFSQALPVGMD